MTQIASNIWVVLVFIFLFLSVSVSPFLFLQAPLLLLSLSRLSCLSVIPLGGRGKTSTLCFTCICCLTFLRCALLPASLLSPTTFSSAHSPFAFLGSQLSIASALFLFGFSCFSSPRLRDCLRRHLAPAFPVYPDGLFRACRRPSWRNVSSPRPAHLPNTVKIFETALCQTRKGGKERH